MNDQASDISINPGGLNKRTSLHPPADQLRLDEKIRSIYSRVLQKECFSVCCHVCFLQLKRAKLREKMFSLSNKGVERSVLAFKQKSM